MRALSWTTAFRVLLVTLACPLALAQAQNFTFAAIGDVPYGPPAELAQLADTLNGKPLAFTIHVGDIKSGSSLCSDDAFATVHALFERFAQPLIYTPGDNEWTDCHRTSNGGHDPLERLEKIRTLFFATPESLGKRRITLEAQSEQAPFRRFVENRRWSHGHVSFATLHLVGSNNNLDANLPSSSEFNDRNSANIAWMRATFAQAKARNDVAVVLAMQADTFFGAGAQAGSGFSSWLTAFGEEARAWDKPVLLIQGDTHEFTLDQPVLEGKRLSKVTRLVVQGGRNVKAALVEVDENNMAQPFVVRLLDERRAR